MKVQCVRGAASEVATRTRTAHKTSEASEGGIAPITERCSWGSRTSPPCQMKPVIVPFRNSDAEFSPQAAGLWIPISPKLTHFKNLLAPRPPTRTAASRQFQNFFFRIVGVRSIHSHRYSLVIILKVTSTILKTTCT